MKLKKKSGLMGAVIALSAASLVSVGFASWVISQGDTQYASGSIIVDTVDDQSHKISITGEPADIVFAGPATTSQTLTGQWLTSNGSKVQNLTAYVDVSVTNVLSTSSPSDLTFTVEAGTLSAGENPTFSPESGNTTGYARALSEGLVGALPTCNGDGIEAGKILLGEKTYSANPGEGATRGTMSFRVTLNFVWGEDFGNKNPYNYYNEDYTAAQKAEEAKNQLELLEECLSGVSYRLTISAAASSSL